MKPLTEQEIDMIQYFAFEKGDATRWVNWLEVKPRVAHFYPEVIAAIDALTVAERTLKAVIKNMEPSHA